MPATGTSFPASDTAPPHVLVVDDDVDVGLLLSRYLNGQGLSVTVAETARRLFEVMNQGPVDLILLDLGLPDADGLSVMRDLRLRWQGPIIIVSGRGESVERVVGLELGADDYVSKPFELRELLARIRSVLRRSRPPAAAEAPSADLRGFQFAGLRLDLSARQLTQSDQPVPLTSGEFELLVALLQRPHQVLSRDQLMNAVHGRDAGPYDRAIDVQIGRLRRKLEDDPANPRMIKSVRGAGYLFAVPVQRY